MKIERFMSILSLLRAHGRISGHELAKHLEVSSRTLRRDMAAMTAAGLTICVPTELGDGWQLSEAWSNQAPNIGASELHALLTLGANPLSQLRDTPPKSQDEKTKLMQQRLYVDSTDWRGTSENRSTFRTVQEAVWHDRKLAIVYWRAGHERAERIVDPLGLVAKAGVWYLVANTPGGFRTYRLSRIEQAEILDQASERPAGFDLASHWNTSTRQFQEGRLWYQATLRLEPRAASWMRMWQFTSHVQADEDPCSRGWVTLRVQFEHEEQACFVVLGLGPRVEVLEPESLRTRVALDAAAGMCTSIDSMDGNSFAPLGFDELFRELETQRRAAASKLESERRAAQELEIAKQVQARLFPQTLPPVRSLDYAGICIQAREVGGDYYDFLDLGQARLGLILGDISGKGIAAALLMANLQANLRSQCAIAWDHPQRLLRSANQLFCENTSDNAYATLFFAVYDDTVGHLAYANCGHHSALLFRNDGCLERLDSTGTVLGLFKEWECSIGERKLFSGDTLALYTDGITEAFNDAGEEFGERRLIETFRRHRDLSSEDLLAAVVDEVRKFSPREQHDDITLIVARCREGQ